MLVELATVKTPAVARVPSDLDNPEPQIRLLRHQRLHLWLKRPNLTTPNELKPVHRMDLVPDLGAGAPVIE